MQFTLSRRAFTAGAAILPMACTQAGKTALNGSPTLPARWTSGIVNPLVKQRADAQVFRHEDGYYYMTGSVPEYDRLVLRRARTLAELTDAEERVLWRHEASGLLSGFIWAPELHLVDGRWVIYFAAGPSGGGEDVFRIRTYAIVCDGADPMRGSWSVLGQFEAPWDSFNLDSSMFMHRGTRYFVWAQREPGIDTNSNLYIAPMASALTLAAKPARLTVPTLDWEIRGFKVNEAPAVLKKNGKLFISYSASATDARYCLGLLTADAQADIMDPRSWTKSPKPVFTTCEETSVYGPGHNSFTVDEQGRDMLVYHGRDYAHIEGDPLFNPDRHTRVQRLYFDINGNPDFGVPVGNGPLPDRFQAAVSPNTWLAHEGQRLFAGTAALPQTQFRSIPVENDTVRLSPILLRGQCLNAGPDGVITLTSASGTSDNSLFRRIPGPTRETVQLESAVRPGMAIAASRSGLQLAPASTSATLWRVS